MKNMNKVNLMKVLGLVVFLFVFGVGIAQAAPKREPKIIVGANLKEYKQPNKKQCDINVPKQYPTIQAGVDAAVAGDTVCVGAGTYNEEVLINKSIRLSGNGFKDRSAINAKGQSAAVLIYANNVILEGFVLNGVGLDSRNAALLIGEADSNVTIRYNRIVAGDGSIALRADGAQNHHLIQNNVFKGNNSPMIAGVSGAPLDPNKASDDVDFVNNTFRGTTRPTGSDPAVVLGTAATNSSIERNVFNTTGTSTVLVSYDYGSGTAGVNYNNFNSNATIKVAVSVGTLNAENNWWGDRDPSDNIRHDVDFTPFATKPFEQYHVKINKKK